MGNKTNITILLGGRLMEEKKLMQFNLSKSFPSTQLDDFERKKVIYLFF